MNLVIKNVRKFNMPRLASIRPDTLMRCRRVSVFFARFQFLSESIEGAEDFNTKTGLADEASHFYSMGCKMGLALRGERLPV